ncbi:hypothetical protein N9933_00890 [bacterium]|nr:hypothetical protein [bacterium]
MIYKTLTNTLLISLALLLCSSSLFSQLSIDVTAGTPLSQHELSKGSFKPQSLGSYSGRITYLPKRVGLSLQLSANSYASNEAFLSQFHSVDTRKVVNTEKWKSNFLFLGPVFKLGPEKVNLDFFPKVGLGNIKSADRELYYDTGQDEYLLYSDNAAEKRLNGLQFIYGLDTKLNFRVTPSIGVHLSGGLNTNKFIGEGNSVTYRETTPSGIEISEEELLDGRLIQKECPSYELFNLGAGMTFSFGNNKKTKPERLSKTEEQKEAITCLHTILQTPQNNSSFVLETKRRPDFKWVNTDRTIKYFEFQLFEGQRLILKKKTRIDRMVHGSDLEKIYASSKGKDKVYSWNVKTFYNDCPPQETARFNFIMKSSGGAIIEVYRITCDEPAFDSAGNLHYTATVDLTNPITSGDNWTVSSLTLLPGPTTIPVTSLYACSGPPISPAGPTLSIAPGNTETWCFDFIVPIGSPTITSTANGTMYGGPSSVTDQDSLPSCICDHCDNWQFSSSFSSLRYTPAGGDVYNANLFQNIQISGSDPIMKVKAEIVSVQHTVNDPQCYTCTKDDNHMGMISYGGVKPRVIITSGSWANGNNAYEGTDNSGNSLDVNGDDYLNQVVWQAANPSVGINFSSTSHRFRIPINLPKPSELDCCDHDYKVCVRYTFTDINCVSCDYLKCYKLIFKQVVGTGGTGVGTGVGTSLPHKK